MNEADLTYQVQSHLRCQGFKVFKHCDRFTRGVPDTSASRDGITRWLEFKAVRRSKPATSLCWATIIKPKDMVQLANMVELERCASASYVLFQIHARSHSIHLVEPSRVLMSVKQKIEISIPEAISLEDLWPR